MITLAGGWGYNNLGDEAILAGYLSHFASTGEGVQVLSVNPARTAGAQATSSLAVLAEAKHSSRSGSPLVLGGGGYLNGRWMPEIYQKLRRLHRIARESGVSAHAVELRELDRRPIAGLARAVFSGASVSVRDVESAHHASSIGLSTTSIVPDAISLLYPHVQKYAGRSSEFSGKVVLNLLDIGDRNDSDQAEVDVRKWRQFCIEILGRLGDRAVCLVVGGGDYRFARTLGAVRLYEPKSVEGLVSAVAGADAVLSVRMHPALISTMTGTPTLSVPYCGKVRPTLTKIGLEEHLLMDLDADLAMEFLNRSGMDSSAKWHAANLESSEWLEDSIRRSAVD